MMSEYRGGRGRTPVGSETDEVTVQYRTVSSQVTQVTQDYIADETEVQLQSDYRG